MSKEFIVQEMSLLNELLYPGQSVGNIRNNLSRLQSIFDANDLSIPTVINSVRKMSTLNPLALYIYAIFSSLQFAKELMQ